MACYMKPVSYIEIHVNVSQVVRLKTNLEKFYQHNSRQKVMRI